MQFMLLIYEDEAVYAAPGAYEAAVKAHDAFAAELVQAGLMRGGAGLQPVERARTVRKLRRKAVVTDGPYAETKEQIGGYYVIEAPDIDAALRWAERLPLAADGAVEVRPLLATGGT